MGIEDKFNDYKPGQEAFYHEDGEICRVKVLEANCDAEKVKYKLKVLEVVQKSKIVVPSDIGDEFECMKHRMGGYSGNWYLIDR